MSEADLDDFLEREKEWRERERFEKYDNVPDHDPEPPGDLETELPEKEVESEVGEEEGPETPNENRFDGPPRRDSRTRWRARFLLVHFSLAGL